MTSPNPLPVRTSETTTPSGIAILRFRSQSGRTEVAVGPRGYSLDVLKGHDILGPEDAARLAAALTSDLPTPDSRPQSTSGGEVR